MKANYQEQIQLQRLELLKWKTMSLITITKVIKALLNSRRQTVAQIFKSKYLIVQQKNFTKAQSAKQQFKTHIKLLTKSKILMHRWSPKCSLILIIMLIKKCHEAKASLVVPQPQIWYQTAKLQQLQSKEAHLTHLTRRGWKKLEM